MPNYIKPTLQFVSNSETSTTDPGPMSFALNLTTTPTADVVSGVYKGRLSVDDVDQRLYTTSDTITSLLDGSEVGGGTETPATVGCYIYLKNHSTTSGDNIYIGIVAGGGSDTPAAPAASGTTALDEATNATLRTMTLLPGEFAFFPFDYTGDIYYEAAAGKTPKLEYWRFDKA